MDDDAAQPDPWQLRQRPENEVPVSVPIDAVLAEGDGLAVFLSGARVYDRGLEFTVTAVTRRSQRRIFDMFHGGERPAERFLLGVEFADGRRAMVDGYRAGEPSSTDQPYLAGGGGGGGGREAHATYFLSPLPPPGPLRFVSTWPHQGIAERVVEIDTAPILEAATRVRELWPWEPVDDAVEEETQEGPDLPEGSWFRGWY